MRKVNYLFVLTLKSECISSVGRIFKKLFMKILSIYRHSSIINLVINCNVSIMVLILVKVRLFTQEYRSILVIFSYKSYMQCLNCENIGLLSNFLH